MFYGLSLLPLVAAAAPNDCRHVPDGVLCTLPAFNLLIDAHSMCRADLKVANLRIEDLQRQMTLCDAKVAELSARLPCPVPPPPVAPDPTRFVGGYVLGLLGAVSVAAAAGFPLPEPVRLGMGLAGVAGIGVGMVLVLP